MAGKKAKENKEIIFMVEESPEGGFEAQALGFSIYTEGETLDELRQAIKDSVNCHFSENQRPSILHYERS